MRACVIKDAFGLENLRVLDVEPPRPGRSEVLLKVRAMSLNYRDVMVADGRYNPRYPLPLTLGSDAVGEVVELGADTGDSGLSLGDRVCPLVAQGWLDGLPSRSVNQRMLGGPAPGVFAEYALSRADSVVKAPEHLSDAEAATLPCAALTAFSALAVLGKVEAGQHVLTLGSGGVSVFALQIARMLGARVVATSRDPEKRERLLALGAETVLDPQTKNWGHKARTLAPEGMDHVIDVGGADTLAESLAAVRPGGIVSLIGVLGGKQANVELLSIVMRNVRVQGVLVGHRRGFRELCQAFSAAKLRPVIDSVYPLSDAASALERLASGQHVGKICLSV